LKKENFKIFLDKTEQKITDFSVGNEPATIGFIIDTSGSMTDGTIRKRSDVSRAKLYARGIESLVQNGNNNNQYFVMAFDQKPDLVSDITSDLSVLQKALISVLLRKPGGNTAFLTALDEGIKTISKSNSRKKVLIALTDGQDNLSQNKEKLVKKLLREKNIIFYAVSLGERYSFYSSLDLDAQALLDRLAQITGGRSFYPANETVATDCLERIGLELKSSYSIEFDYPAVQDGDKFMELKVKAEPLEFTDTDGKKQKIKAFIRTRIGFYPSMAN
jgi:VWFA-related protein